MLACLCIVLYDLGTMTEMATPPSNADIGKLAQELWKRERLVDCATLWLSDGLVRVVAHRPPWNDGGSRHSNHKNVTPARVPWDEVVDVIDFADDESVVKTHEHMEQRMSAVKLPEHVGRLLREYVSVVSGILHNTLSLAS